jgi:ketosteroid isomerase-like protein
MATIATNFDEAARMIRAMDEEFMRNAEAGNAQALVEAFYAEDARVLPPNHPVVGGKSAIREFFGSGLLPVLKSLKLDTTHIEISGDLAYAVGNYSMKMRAEGGGETADKGKYVVVYRRQSGSEWRAVADMFSGDGPSD